jgi:hypothetical protein
MNSIINLVTGIVMIKCKKEQIKREPLIIEFEDDEDEEDLSWMIQNNDQYETENKKLKGKK